MVPPLTDDNTVDVNRGSVVSTVTGRMEHLVTR